MVDRSMRFRVHTPSLKYSDTQRARCVGFPASPHQPLRTLFADQKNHINGIENFWNQAKRHMRRFNDVP
jgi:transposase-like protein